MQTQKLSPKLFRVISSQFSSGSPALGVLIANEYLGPTDPIRLALCTRWRGRADFKDSSVTSAICNGVVANQLDGDWRSQIPGLVLPKRRELMNLTKWTRLRNRDRRGNSGRRKTRERRAVGSFGSA